VFGRHRPDRNSRYSSASDKPSRALTFPAASSEKARELQRAVRSGDPDALALVAEFHPEGPPRATFQLSAAQLVLARRYGFASWPQLRRHVEIVTSSTWQPTRSAPGEDLLAAFLRLSCGGYAKPSEDRARDLRGAHC
jgi:hypothetical protein